MRQHGFTLIELLVALAVAVILATVAVPSFQDIAARNRLSADFNQFLVGFNYARSEAVKRRENVSISVTGDWQVDITDSGGATLRTLASSDGRVTVSAATPDPFVVVFNELGRTSCAIATPCSITLQYEDSETLEVRSSGLISRP